MCAWTVLNKVAKCSFLVSNTHSPALLWIYNKHLQIWYNPYKPIHIIKLLWSHEILNNRYINLFSCCCSKTANGLWKINNNVHVNYTCQSLWVGVKYPVGCRCKLIETFFWHSDILLIVVITCAFNGSNFSFIHWCSFHTQWNCVHCWREFKQ